MNITSKIFFLNGSKEVVRSLNFMTAFIIANTNVLVKAGMLPHRIMVSDWSIL